MVGIYRRYLELKSVHALKDALAGIGINSKRRLRLDGSVYGGQELSLAPSICYFRTEFTVVKLPTRANPIWENIRRLSNSGCGTTFRRCSPRTGSSASRVYVQSIQVYSPASYSTKAAGD